MSAPDQLLVVIDPVARRFDGESVRIAKDVLCAGSAAKICLPDGPGEFSRALARRGSRRPVVIGDDRTLLRAVGLLHRARELADEALSLVPVGARGSVETARSLGVPTGAVAAARAVLDGAAHRLDLLADDSDGVVLADLRIPAGPAADGAAGQAGSVWHACRSLVRTLVRPVPQAPPGVRHRLRVEADGVLLSDLDEPVEDVRVRAADGAAEVTVSRGSGAGPVRTLAKVVTVSGTDFRYRADALVAGPVRHRTWTLRPRAWSLTLPGPRAAAD
ncbi:diacylglycerol kinase [Streptomyces sp. ICN441]|uniref:diacylglycerol kinase n=1 Tax=Streptomyces TaxID=1883 RepID=UPI00106D7CFF|nr:MULTISPECIES: diacylglycerol kinase [Streptomyces]MCY0983817.1 diacylglycerol kinase [Streptomyces tirandamycinicus]NNJ02732.1 diacylglycerol kinase [Streptomyces sp. PKU-MA01144]TFE38226.1 diacylglycerol kinase [Streptomyces sp. ICN441]